MTLAETIQAHVQSLPPILQREPLDFIAWLETRYGLSTETLGVQRDTEAFLAAVAGMLSDDFPDDISDDDLDVDAPREPLD